jgi:hypothetical protein
VSRAKPIAQHAVIRAGIFGARIRTIRNGLDKVIFHVLASGSTLLTIAFSSHSLASLARKFSRVSGPSEARTQFRNAL